MKAYLIDPYTRTVAEVETDGSLDSIYALTKCSMVEPLYLNEALDFVLVDEEACYKPEGTLRPFAIHGRMLLGMGLVLGQYGDEWGAPRMSLEELRAMVQL